MKWFMGDTAGDWHAQTKHLRWRKEKSSTGLEPAISRFVGGCLIHWATKTPLHITLPIHNQKRHCAVKTQPTCFAFHHTNHHTHCHGFSHMCAKATLTNAYLTPCSAPSFIALAHQTRHILTRATAVTGTSLQPLVLVARVLD